MRDGFVNENGTYISSRSLGKKEILITGLVATGMRNRDIAAKVGTTEHVIKNYLRVIYDKLGLWNRVELALWWVANKKVIDSDA